MTTFKNIKELEKYVSSQQGSDTILNQAQVKKVLIEEARRLQRLLREELQSYFTSNPDTKWAKDGNRTGNTVESIRVGTPKRIRDNFWSIEVYWDDSLAYHDSVFGQQQGHTGFLLNYGWDISSKVGYDIPNFTSFDGIGYIEKAISRWNSTNKHGLKITMQSKWK